MRDLNEKYFELGNGSVIHIKETHPQLSVAVTLVEIDDWTGHIDNVLGKYWHLNNKNIMVEVSDQFLIGCLVEITSTKFLDKVKEELTNTVTQFKSGNSWAQTYFKQTDARMKILRSHYGTKP